MTDVSNSRSAPLPAVRVLDGEYDPLADLVCASDQETAGLNLLWQELERATVLPAPQAPADLVRMGSRVRVADLTRGGTRTVRLVFPEEATGPNRVSVTSALGAALIGLRPGDTFAWRDPGDAPGRVRVVAVQPPPTRKPRPASLAELLSEG